MTPDSKIILGIDEVGRGPWAGPLVIGAVILDSKPSSRLELWQDLTDSKKLTAKKRKPLNALIQAHAAAHATGWVSANELDRYGLSASLKLATRRAVKQILAQKIYFDEIIIDGTVNFLTGTPLENRVTTLKKADLLIPAVSAASIIAKVARDTYMVEIAKKYPGYGFEKHVGYGTALHKSALLEQGICPEHRQSFRPIREIISRTASNPAEKPKNSPDFAQNPDFSPQETVFKPSFSIPPSHPTPGQTAEIAALSYLQAQNHEIIAHNYKTPAYEIDLISIENKNIFFTEVKYSENLTSADTPLVRITPEKRHQMHFAAENFLSTHPEYSAYEPLLAVAAVTGTPPKVETWFPLSAE